MVEIMPYFQYECPDCGYEQELWYRANAPDKAECPKCGALSKRTFSPPVIIQKGYEPTDARYQRGKKS